MITQSAAFRLAAAALNKILPPTVRWNEEREKEFFEIDPLGEKDKEELAAQLSCERARIQNPTDLQMVLQERLLEEWRQIDNEHGPIVTEEEFTFLRKSWKPALHLSTYEDCVALARELEMDEQADYDGFSDNGGDPDGNAWLIWPLDQRLIQAAHQATVEVSGLDGFEIHFPRVRILSESETPLLKGLWSGIDCADLVFVTLERDAVFLIRASNWIEEHDLLNEPDEELLTQLPTLPDPSDSHSLSEALREGKQKILSASGFPLEPICQFALTQVIKHHQQTSQALLWSGPGDGRVYLAYTSSPLRDDLAYLVSVANQPDLFSSQPRGKVEEVFQRVYMLLWQTLPAVEGNPPKTFWQTEYGQLLRHVQYQIVGDDFINYTTAAAILYEGEALVQSAATQRVQRLVVEGKLLKFQDPHEQNPRHASRVSRAQVEALARHLRENGRMSGSSSKQNGREQ